MGCDIHVYVERRTNEIWEAVYNTNPYIADYEGYLKTAIERGETERSKQLQDHIIKMRTNEPMVLEGWLYNGRNYNLFSILADIRNKFNITPIDQPRGVPENISKEVDKEYEYSCGDGHSHSYYTFKELLDFDWDNNFIENEAYVDEETYKNFKKTGCPYPCSGDVGGGNTAKVLNSEMERIIKRKYLWEEDKHFYTVIKWKEKYSEAGGNFLDNLNEYIKESIIENLSDYRIVFWFDN